MTPMSIANVSNTPTTVDPFTELADSGDLDAEFAALAVKSGESDRRDADQVQDALEAAQENQENQEVAAMRKKAGDILDGAICDGIGIVASTVASGNSANGVRIGAAGMDGSAKVAGALYDGYATNDDADAAQHKAAADQDASASARAQDLSKAAGDYVSAAVEFYREAASTRSASFSAAVHRA
jgi:hypothetical protein